MKKELKLQHPDLAQSPLDILARLDPSKTNKYLPFMIRRVRKSMEEMQHAIDRANEADEYVVPVSNYLDLCMVHTFTEGGFFPLEELQTLRLFHELSENNRIAQKDINQYRDFEALRTAVSQALMEQEERAKDRAIQVLLDNEDYFILRPLTYESSVKYGYNTKWCTASAHRSSHFHDYTRYGVLVYLYNKKTKEKVAMHGNIEYDQLVNITFWNAADNRIDTYETTFDSITIQTLVRALKKNLISNYNLAQQLSGEDPEPTFMDKTPCALGGEDTETTYQMGEAPAIGNQVMALNPQAHMANWSEQGFLRELEKQKKNSRKTLWNRVKALVRPRKDVYLVCSGYLDTHQRQDIIRNFRDSKLGKTHNLVLVPNFERISFDTIEEQ
jgi:hypothetical protein